MSYYVTFIWPKKMGKQSKYDQREIGSGTNKLLCVSNSLSIMLKINSYWVMKVKNHNWYTDWPLVDYAYYVTFTCLT